MTGTRTFTATFTVTDAEFANFLARLSGVLGNTPTLAAIDGQPVAAGGTAPADDEGGPVNANAPKVDTKGFPWNADFHSANKSLNADGTWRYKRGVDKAKLAAWEATAKQPAPAVAPAQTFTLPASIAGTPQPVQLPDPAPQPIATAMPAFPGFPAPVAPPADVPVTMEMLNAAFAKLGTDGLLAPDGSNVRPLYDHIGMTSGDQLATDETMRRKLLDGLRQMFPTAGL